MPGTGFWRVGPPKRGGDSVLDLNEILVPVDFSPASRAALEQATQMVGSDNPVIVLQHVIDHEVVGLARAMGFDGEEDLLARLRTRAEEMLQELADSVGAGIDVTTVVSEGEPFYEVVRLAEELDVDAVILSKVGAHAGPRELFFGSTAERIVRACNRPVIVLPVSEDPSVHRLPL